MVVQTNITPRVTRVQREMMVKTARQVQMASLEVQENQELPDLREARYVYVREYVILQPNQ